MLDVVWVAHVWDDMIDKDVERSEEDINKAFWISLIGIPNNPFVRNFWGVLYPVMANSIMNYIAANDLEREGTEQQREIAYNARHAPGDIAITVAGLLGGYEWAAQHAAELKAMANERDSMQNYMQEIESRYAN